MYISWCTNTVRVLVFNFFTVGLGRWYLRVVGSGEYEYLLVVYSTYVPTYLLPAGPGRWSENSKSKETITRTANVAILLL